MEYLEKKGIVDFRITEHRDSKSLNSETIK